MTRAGKTQALHNQSLKTDRLSFTAWDKFNSMKVCFPNASNQTINDVNGIQWSMLEGHSVLLPFGDTGIHLGRSNLLIFYSSAIYIRGQHTSSVKGRVLNILGFASQLLNSAILV